MRDMAAELPQVPSYVGVRLPLAVERATQKAATVTPNRDASALVRAAQKASTSTQRVTWLHRAASAWAQPLEEVAACRRGCAHCCHIAVTISSTEAAIIGRHIGEKPAEPESAIQLDSGENMAAALADLEAQNAHRVHSSCPFLVNNTCSIYSIRPMACRLLLNLDDDDLLCRLVPGQEIPVPYADSRQLRGLFLMAQASSKLADIRDFFPDIEPM